MNNTVRFPNKDERRCSAPPPASRYSTSSSAGTGLLTNLQGCRFRRFFQRRTSHHETQPFPPEETQFSDKRLCNEDSQGLLICLKCAQDLKNAPGALTNEEKQGTSDETSTSSDWCDNEDVDSGVAASSTQCSTSSAGSSLTERLRQILRLQSRRLSSTSSSLRCDSGQGDEDLVKPIPPVFETVQSTRRHSVAVRPTSPQSGNCILCNKTISNDEISDVIVRPQTQYATNRGSGSSNRHVGGTPVPEPKPPKEPHKLPLCQANSGITFADNNIRLAEQFRARSSSVCQYQKRLRTNRSKSEFDTTPVQEGVVSNPKLWQALNDVRESNRLTQALLEENRLYMGSQPSVSRSMSRISESSRYITISRTPCGQRNSRSEDENRVFETDAEEYSAGLTAMFQHASVYETLPDSSKLIVVCSELPISRGYQALINNQVNAAPVWNQELHCFDAVLSLTDFLPICQQFSSLKGEEQEAFQKKTIAFCLDQIQEYVSPVIFLQPDQHIHDALEHFHQRGAKHIIVSDPLSGNVLSILTPQRLLRYLWTRCYEYVLQPAQHWLWQTVTQAATKLALVPFDKESASEVTSSLPSVTLNTNMDEVIAIFLHHRKTSVAATVLPVFHGGQQNSSVWIDLLTENDVVKFLLSQQNPLERYLVKDCLNYKHRIRQARIFCRTTDSVCILMDTFYRHDMDCVAIVDGEQGEQLRGLVYLTSLLQYLVSDEHC